MAYINHKLFTLVLLAFLAFLPSKAALAYSYGIGGRAWVGDGGEWGGHRGGWDNDLYNYGGFYPGLYDYGDYGYYYGPDYFFYTAPYKHADYYYTGWHPGWFGY